MLISSSTNEDRKSSFSLDKEQHQQRGRGLDCATDASAARWASGGSRPQAATPGQPCAGQTESGVDLATRGFLLDTSHRC